MTPTIIWTNADLVLLDQFQSISGHLTNVPYSLEVSNRLNINRENFGQPVWIEWLLITLRRKEFISNGIVMTDIKLTAGWRSSASVDYAIIASFNSVQHTCAKQLSQSMDKNLLNWVFEK